MKNLFFIFIVIFSIFSNYGFSDEHTPSNGIEIVQNDLEDDSYKELPNMEYKSSFIRMFFVLFALIALIFLSFYLFKRFVRMKMIGGNSNKNIQILEKRALSPKTLLYLIEVDGKKMVVSESHLDVRKINDLDHSRAEENPHDE